MEYRNLGRTGLVVSELCLGAMTFGNEADETESHRMLDQFLAAGGNFIDTADVYTRGRSEEILGAWLKTKDRTEVVVATKVRWGTDPGNARRPNQSGLGRKHIMAAVDASLKRLGTDYIDLYQVHMWDSRTALEETLETFDILIRSGKIRYAGASNFSGWQLQKAVDLARQHGWEPYVSLQALYNLLDRELEWELLPICRNEGLGVLPWSPLRGGWLTGKYHRGMTAPVAGARIETIAARGGSETWERYAVEHTWNIVDSLAEIGRRLNKTPAQVALRWLLQQPGVTSPIVGARSRQQLEENLGATGWSLEPQDLRILEEVSRKRLPYPYDHLVRA